MEETDKEADKATGKEAEKEKICSICCNHYTPYVRRRVECLYCNHECCRTCISQYILSSSCMPQCMSCRKSWNREFMYNSMTKNFVIETLKKHTEQIMLDREKALLPATQPIVERLKIIENNYNSNLTINNKIFIQRREERETLNMLRDTRTTLISNGLRMKNIELNISEILTDSDQSDEERQDIRRHHAKLPNKLQTEIYKLKLIRREIRALERDRRANQELNNHLIRMNQRRKNALTTYVQGNTEVFEYATSESENEEDNHTNQGTRKNKRKVFIRSCPKEDCRGFLNTRWTCGLCETNVCSKCHEIKEKENVKEHLCDPNSVATAQILMKDTKACPKCGVQIHKIDGCNMMFCTQCHTPFCWRTGEIIKNERIHNPHYYEWLRQNSKDGNIPREQGDEIGDICNDPISVRTIRTKLASFHLLSHEIEDMIWNTHRISVHIEMVEIPILTNYLYDNVDLRISYLSNEYTETAWKQELYRRAKRTERNNALRQIYEMIRMVITNELRKFITLDEIMQQNVIDCVITLNNLHTYANQQFLEVSRLYQCIVPKLESNTWRISKQKAELHVKRRRIQKEEVDNEEEIEELEEDDKIEPDDKEIEHVEDEKEDKE